MIINRRFIFALVLLCLARPVHTQTPLLTPAEIEVMRSDLYEQIIKEGCEEPLSDTCERFFERLADLEDQDGRQGELFVNDELGDRLLA